MFLIFQSEKLRNRSRDTIWVPQCSDNMPISRIHTTWCCCPVISLKMPTGPGKACNQRPQSLMSRERGEGGNDECGEEYWPHWCVLNLRNWADFWRARQRAFALGALCTFWICITCMFTQLSTQQISYQSLIEFTVHFCLLKWGNFFTYT